MTKVNKKDSIISKLLGLGIVVAFILPHASAASLIVNPLLCILFWLLKDSKTISKVSGFIVVPILLSFFTNLQQLSSLKPVLLCITLALYSLLFPFTDRQICLKPSVFYLTLSFILISQLAYVLDIPFLTNLLDSLYPFEGENESLYSHMRNTITVENMLNYRLGGLYRNPNDCARAITLLLVSFLILFHDKRVFPFIALSVGGVLLTGSRTGAVVAIIIIIAFFFFCRQSSTTLKLGIVAVSLTVVVLFSISSNSIFRALDITRGFENSANLKWDTFTYYFMNETSLIKILFGYLDPTRFDSNSVVMAQFDADYGYLIFNYGLVGFVGILLFNINVGRRLTKSGRVYFLILLWMVTSTIFSSYRCVFEYLLLLSLVHNNNRQYIKYLPQTAR